MLQDIVVHSIHSFESDCQKLCLQHYPAVHNGGMTEQHLGLAFARRINASFTEFGQIAEVTPLDNKKESAQTNSYRVTSPIGTVWVISHHFVNANLASREKLYTNILEWQSEHNYALQSQDVLVIVADHWLNRCTHSRKIIHWWCAKFPTDVDSYVSQGVRLLESDSTLGDTLRNRLQLLPYFISHTHPLQRPSVKQQVKKYVQLFAVVRP
ncbi:hypothetical protein ACPV4B_15040 [Vibrio parahaemolyticus]|uniref:hypothetical protein n=1 Tax=Vibrio mediterranei TaxID=689 RepID=UPI0040688146